MAEFAVCMFAENLEGMMAARKDGQISASYSSSFVVVLLLLLAWKDVLHRSVHGFGFLLCLLGACPKPMIGNRLSKSEIIPVVAFDTDLFLLVLFLLLLFDRDRRFGIWQRNGSSNELPDLWPMSHGRMIFYFTEVNAHLCYRPLLHSTISVLQMIECTCSNPRFVPFFIYFFLSFLLSAVSLIKLALLIEFDTDSGTPTRLVGLGFDYWNA
jgi:hypothetical protein